MPRVGVARAVERAADRGHHAVHHAARRHDVGARPPRGSPRRGRGSRAWRRCRPLPPRRTPQWPWLVYSQQQTSVRSSRSGVPRAQPPERPLDDAVLGEVLRPDLVLGGGQAEQQHRGDAERRGPGRPPGRATRPPTGGRPRASRRSRARPGCRGPRTAAGSGPRPRAGARARAGAGRRCVAGAADDGSGRWARR